MLAFLSIAFAPKNFAAQIVLTVTPPAPQTFVEQTTNPLTFVTFRVTNNDPVNTYILDYAAEIITWPADIDDQVWNNGFVSAATYILPATPANVLTGANVGLYTFGVYNPFGDPITDCCDNGLNPISFVIEMSLLATFPNAANIATNAGYGQFVFQTGGSSTGTEDPVELNLLQNCLANNNCPAAIAHGPLFNNGIDGLPDPALTSVTVLDTPEPATWCFIIGGCAVLALRKLRTRQM